MNSYSIQITTLFPNYFYLNIMRKLITKLIAFSFFISSICNVDAAVTAPTCQSLPYNQDFSSWTGSSSTLPAGWAVWKQSSAITSSFPTGVSSADKGITTTSATNANSTWGGINYNGSIGWLGGTGGDPTAVLGLITTSYSSNIVLQYDISTVRVTSATDYNEQCQLQYATSSSSTTWIAIAGTTYSSGTTVATTGGPSYQNTQTFKVVLPAGCLNQATLYLRWVDRGSGTSLPGSSNAPTFALDNISVSQYSSPAITSITPTTSTSICSNATQDLTVNGISGTSTTVTWWTATGGTGTNLGTGTTLTSKGPGTYYARVTNVVGAAETSITIGTSAVTSISSQPISLSTFAQNSTPTALSVTASGTGTLAYQWNTCDVDGNNINAISSANNSTYSPPTSSVGTSYYNCTVNGACSSSTSSVATVNVISSSSPILSYTSGNTIQTISAGTSIGNIVYTWGGSATSANISWTGSASTLPTGLNATSDGGAQTITISGSPSVAGTYNYSITSTDGTNTSSALTGTIIVKLATPDVSAGATTITGSGFTAQWAAVSGVTNYTVKVYQNSSEVVAARQTGVTGTSVTISGLSSKTAYTYTATAIGDGSLIPNSNESSTASVTTKSTDKAITSFSVAGQQPSSNINESAKTVTVYVAPGTSLSSLTPTITVSANATVSPASGVTTDFTNTVSYTVTAEDGSQQVYSVSVLLGSSATDYFKSKISGNWSNYTTWQSSSDNQNWMDASLVPDYNSTSIQIKNGTIVSVDASTTIDDMSIDSGGEVDVISGQTFTVSNGTLATDLDISGKFKNNGTVTISTGATVVAERGALYDHALGGATLTAPPTISWATGSTLKISGTYTNATATSAGSLPSGTYKNILISCNITTSDAFMVLGGISIDTLSIEATGNGEILSTTGSATTCATYSQKGGNFYCQRGSSSTRSLTVTGNCSVSGGVLDIRQGASSGLGQLFVGGDLSITGSGSLISNPSSTGTATLVFNGSGIQNFINTGSITASGTNGAIAIVVNSTATLNMSSSTFGTSNSTFTTQTGATLKTSHASGINGNLTVTGTKTLDQGTNYIFNGAATQVTGALLTTANNIEIANSSGVSLSANTTVNGTLNLTSGQLNKNGFTLTLGNSATVATTAGSLSGAPTFGTSVNLIYTGASTKGNEFPATDIVNSLTANNTAGIALASNYNIPTVSIGSGSSISVAAGKQLTVGTSFTNAGTLNLASDDTGTATILTPSTITGSGTANVQQYMTTGRNWYVSCPVTSSASSVLNLGTSVVSYNEPNASWDTETALTPGKGYISVATTGTAAPVTFSGTLNNGNIPVALTRTAGQTKEGFNLVGNPYPSYLIWNEATATAANTLTTIWYRTKDAGVYAFYTYNPVSDIAAPSTAGITAYIPPMQAFWVRVNSGGGTLSFSNAMRAHADVSTNMLKVKSSTQNTQQVLRLQVSNGTNSDETVVLFNPNASNLLDNYDSPKMSNTNKVIPELFTTIDNNELVINGLNSTETVSELPLGFRTGETNNFTIKAIQVSNFAPDMHIILRDIDQKTEQDITNGTAYSFSSSETSSAGRFAVIFKSNSTTTGLHNNALSNVAVYRNANNQILISCPEALIGNSSVTVFNAIGQTLLGSLVNSTKTVVGNNLTPGVYVVVFKSEAETVSRKVVIE